MAKDFCEFVTDLDHGQVFQQLNEDLQRVVDGVELHDGKGELSIKITLEKKGQRIVASARIASKVPREPVADTLFFAAPGGGLCREDPRQLKLKRLADKAVNDTHD
jgi:hypothetical protein